MRDSAELAERNRTVLDVSRSTAARLAAETLRICREGRYPAPSGSVVLLGEAIAGAVSRKRSLRPNDELPRPASSASFETEVEISNETTASAARRLSSTCGRVLALNFANGTTPGGGFLGGARAQEESLCRMSALYPTIEHDEMYAAHRDDPVRTSDWVIRSPAVPFFRDDAGELLERPWTLDILTSAAPIATHLEAAEARTLLRHRIQRVLAVARAFEYDGLVLGAWGCGAFRNDPVTTAADFRAALAEHDGAFRRVSFAITDWSTERKFLGPFRDAFSDASD